MIMDGVTVQGLEQSTLQQNGTRGTCCISAWVEYTVIVLGNATVWRKCCTYMHGESPDEHDARKQTKPAPHGSRQQFTVQAY